MVGQNGNDPNPSPLEVARRLLEIGIHCLPIAYGEKGVHREGWQHERYGDDVLERVFAPPTNIGAQLGDLSRGLVDCDLDWRESGVAGQMLLPPTKLMWGRSRKPRSHYMYRLSPDDLEHAKNIDYKDPVALANSGGEKAMICQLRVHGQTIAPGSTNRSDGLDDHVRFEADGNGKPVLVLYATLASYMGSVASATLVARYWSDGNRYDATLPLAGMLWHGGMPEDAAAGWLRAMCRSAGDEEVDKRLSVLHDTYHNGHAGSPITGAPTLEDYLDERIIRKVRQWLNLGEGAHAPGNVAGQVRSITWAADQFRDRYSDRLCYVAAWNRWYLWNGRFWQPDEKEVDTRYGYEMIKALYTEAMNERDDASRASRMKVASSFDSMSSISAFTAAARALDPIAMTTGEMDQQDWEVVAANGVIDLRDGMLHPFRQDSYHTRRLGPGNESILYDENADCPRWLEFLDMVLEGRREDILFIQRAGGYSLTGNTSEQCWFILTGDGNNGKSTFTRVLKDVAGTYGHELPVEALLTTHSDRHPVDVADLAGVRFAVAGENDEGRSLSESRLKQITGGDDMRARHMYGKPFTFTPKVKLWMHTNHKPRVRGRDLATWRRIKIVPFNYTISKVEKHFYEHVLRPELPGILMWLIRGCLAWQRDGSLGEPESVHTAHEEYRDENDLVKQYLDANVFEEEGNFLRSSVLYDHYSRWCKQQSLRPESQNVFSQRVSEQTTLRPVQKRTANGIVRGFFGLKLEEDDFVVE